MTPDSDDLETALRENLKLRRELAAEVVNEESANQRGGMAYRLCRHLYKLTLEAASAAARKKLSSDG
jgi:hypothetical protein